MKRLAALLLVIPAAFGAVGCADNGPAVAEDVTAQIQSMPAEERFEMIKNNTGMSSAMKNAAIDNLPVDDLQKQKWKQELTSAPEGTVPTNR